MNARGNFRNEAMLSWVTESGMTNEVEKSKQTNPKVSEVTSASHALLSHWSRQEKYCFRAFVYVSGNRHQALIFRVLLHEVSIYQNIVW